MVRSWSKARRAPVGTRELYGFVTRAGSPTRVRRFLSRFLIVIVIAHCVVS